MMRMPVLGNVLKKTGGRLKWYLIEVLPLFLIGTLIMFGLDRSGALPWIIEAGKPLVVDWLGLPPEAGAAFVMGFLRRDFGASGLLRCRPRSCRWCRRWWAWSRSRCSCPASPA